MFVRGFSMGLQIPSTAPTQAQQDMELGRVPQKNPRWVRNIQVWFEMNKSLMPLCSKGKSRVGRVVTIFCPEVSGFIMDT